MPRVSRPAPSTRHAHWLPHRLALACALALGVAACVQVPSATSSHKPDATAEGAWPSVGGAPGRPFHSALARINTSNVARLGLAWEFKTGTHRVLEATPVLAGDALVTSGPLGRVWSLDAKTGALRWEFEPEVDMQVNRAACCDWANRGVAVSEQRVFTAALDGWLYALDEKTGQVLWKTDTIVDRSRGYTSTGAPEVANGLVIIGNAGAEFDVRGYVSAYEAATGKLVWRFWTVPHDPALGPQEGPHLEAALKTWSPKSRWDVGGGGAVWDAIVYDRQTDTVFIGTDNGLPYVAGERSPGGGDNLYVASIVALDARTGRMRWHYQQTPAESWDGSSTQPMILTDLVVDGVKRPVILHAPKNGFLYVLDRRDGTLLKHHKLVRVNWTTGIDPVTGRPAINPAADYSTGPKFVFPAVSGAHNWHPMSWSAETGLLYVPVQDMGNLMFAITDGKLPRQARRLNANAAMVFGPDLPFVLPALPPPLQAAVQALPEWQDKSAIAGGAYLRAIDPLTGKVAWEVGGTSVHDRAGVLSTRGNLVFQGTDDGLLKAFDAKTGTLLKSIDVGTSIVAAPMTYEIGGEQYVAVAAAGGGGGWGYPRPTSAQFKYGNDGRILVFKLDGGAVEKPALRQFPPIPAPPAQRPGTSAATIAQGQQLFMANCAICHSNMTGSNLADLRRMPAATHAKFKDIVLRGAMLPAGMPRWDDVFDEAQVDAIQAYLIALQGDAHAAYTQAQREGRNPDAATAATTLRAH